MTEEIRACGFPASKARVERLMSKNGIRARHKRRYHVTTDSRHTLPVAPNLLNHDFTPDAPNQVFSSDITSCQFPWRSPGLNQLDDLRPEFRRIWIAVLCHDGHLLNKRIGVHENGSTPGT
ncbi:putative transposase [Burkholderia pseudomallei PB08298010]|nr:putative transposase [Burkholderia pseudomallei PB08298010]